MASPNLFACQSITLERELAEAAEALRRCTLEVRGTDAGRGSGVIWRADGLVMTNAHVELVRPFGAAAGRPCACGGTRSPRSAL